MSKKRPLDNAELGDIGEDEFQRICGRAQLICNKSGKDRAGWDYVVEDKIIHKEGSALDERQNPISCLFQQKTMWSENNSIKFRLSSLERLAKDPRPSFIYAIKLNENLEVDQAYIIHMMDDALMFVLSKLREKRSNGQFIVNQEELKLSVSKYGKAIEHSGQALRAELESIVKDDMQSYIAMKREKLEGLGFESHPYSLKFVIQLESPDELLNFFLGLKQKLKISKIENYQTRFGITIKDEHFPGSGELSVKPEPVDKCTLTFKRKIRSRPIIFKADSYFAPPMFDIVDKAPVVMFRTPCFTMMIRKGRINFKTIEFDAEEPRLEIDMWCQYFELIIALTHGNLTLEVQPESMKRFSLHLNEALFEVDLERIQFYLDCATALRDLCQVAGFDPAEKMSLKTFIDQARRIRSILAFLNSVEKLSPLSFSVEGQSLDTLPKELKGIFVNFVRINRLMIVMSVDVMAERREIDARSDFVSTEMEVRDLDIIEGAEYEKFRSDLSELSGVDFVFARNETDSEDDIVQDVDASHQELDTANKAEE